MMLTLVRKRATEIRKVMSDHIMKSLGRVSDFGFYSKYWWGAIEGFEQGVDLNFICRYMRKRINRYDS